MIYYLFMRKPEDLKKYKAEFERVSPLIKEGRTTVYCEMRAAKTNLIESGPYNFLNGIFLIAGAFFINKMNLPELLSIAVVLIINNFMGAVANYIFCSIKDRMRRRILRLIDEEYNNHNLAVMEALEYIEI